MGYHLQILQKKTPPVTIILSRSPSFKYSLGFWNYNTARGENEIRSSRMFNSWFQGGNKQESLSLFAEDFPRDKPGVIASQFWWYKSQVNWDIFEFFTLGRDAYFILSLSFIKL